MQFNEIIASLFKGIIPPGMEHKTQFIKEIMKFEHRITSSTAILITAARRDDFKEDQYWQDWCEDNFGFTSAHRCHMVQCGRLLLDFLKKTEIFQFLFELDHQKLLSLERIDRLKLPEFLKANDVATLNRDAVRDAVNNFLGCEEPNNKMPAKPGEKYHPDLFEMIGSVCALRVQTVIDSITDVKKADQACDSGLKLYACSLNYYKQNPETLPIEKIEKLEKAMESELEELRGLKATAAGFKIAK